MTGRLPPGAETRGGRPVAPTVATAVPRGRVRLCGRLLGVECRERHGPCVEAALDDGTGRISLRWLGRHAVPGVAPGALVTVEGTVVDERGHWVLINPRYQFCRSPAGCPGGGRPPGAAGSGLSSSS